MSAIKSVHAIFLGRFQPFHIGHRSIVEKILASYPSMTLIIGSSDKSGTDENPWTFSEREAIVRASIDTELQTKITIIGLADVPDDDIWCKQLQEIIPYNSVLFTGNEWVRGICARHDIQTDWIDSYTIDISGTKIRERIKRGEDVSQWTKMECLKNNKNPLRD